MVKMWKILSVIYCKNYQHGGCGMIVREYNYGPIPTVGVASLIELTITVLELVLWLDNSNFMLSEIMITIMIIKNITW